MARNRQRAKQRRARREAKGVPSGVNARAEEPTGPSDGLEGAPSKTDAVAEAVVAASTPMDGEKKQRDAKPAKSKPAAKPEKQEKQRGRFISFLRSSWAELQRVQWPDRRQVTSLTTIVIGFVIIAGAYLGLIDAAASRLVDLII
ncbi:MAG TPA: preprotein translocase subunit SecE [Solirubrobacterales bacterium]|jgi:preprotein translocase SecE subunit|nr:preprotein translocase subunit SecE [Solirubrobacterales bacterium]